MLPGRLIYWSGTADTGYAFYGGLLITLSRRPRLLLVGAEQPLDYYALFYLPQANHRMVTMRDRRNERQRHMTDEECLACDRLLEAMSRGARAIASGDRKTVLALLRHVGAAE